MKKSGLLGSSAIGTITLFGASLAVATPAYAWQNEDQECTAEEQAAGTCTPPVAPVAESEAGGAITVTGSRIRRPNIESTVPITTVTGEEFHETGQVSVGDVLNELPALRSTFSQANSTRFLGTAGLSLLDLRGLGTVRTLVLQNGRRHVAGDVLGSGFTTDVNAIPTDLIERVDVVTGGNSAIYGSDAIAGVVNFVLRRDYEGVQLRGQAGFSKYGDAGAYFTSVLAGHNFADGRANVTINLEYARQDDTYPGRRRNISRLNTLLQVDNDPPGAPADNEFDFIFFEDLRPTIFDNGGTVYFCCNFIDPVGNPNIGGSGLFVVPYLFRPDGTLVPQTGTDFVGRSYFGYFIGGNGTNGREGTQLGLLPRLDRYAANLLAHYEVSPLLDLFVEAKYSRTDSLGNASGPFFTASSGSPRDVWFTDNPFLNPQARSTILLNQGLNPATDESYFYLLRNVVELTNREEDARRETYRIVVGARGDFNEDWSYEISANYGRLDERTRILGNVNVQRYLLAIDAVRAPNGQIVCRASIDPTARIAYENAFDPAFAQATLAADVAACVPINLFGEGNISDAARNYLLQDSQADGRLTQTVFNAFLSGDSSQWFELPGGPVGFAIGAEYRRQTLFYQQDAATAAGVTFYNAIPTIDPPAFEVKEAFAELRLPILRDVPFFQDLTFSGAVRVADYRGATGTVYAYNVGGEWAPIRDIRFRANYSRAVRAPNSGELFTPEGVNFAPGFLDPCSLSNRGGGPNPTTRAANCLADGVPAAYDFQYTSSLRVRSGGNPDLNAERSDSWTAGAVIQPRFIPGLAISVDYYDITVNNVISAVTPQNIVDICYDSADINNQFCDLFDRNPGPGLGPAQEIPGRIFEGNLLQAPVNFASLRTRGIDAELNYRRNIGRLGLLSARINYTHVFQNDQFLNPVDPGRADQILLELGNPQDEVNANFSLDTGLFTFGYQLRYIGKMVTNAFEDFFSVQGRPPANPDRDNIRFYPEVWYHDVRVAIDPNEHLNVYFGIENLFDRDPPFGLTGIGPGSGIYTNIGRRFYAGAVVRF